MKYEILKGVPLPTGYLNKYPFPMMEVGDCFYAAIEEFGKIRTAAYRRHERSKQKYIVRKLDSRVGVWRVK